jgi:hypothetical protein
MGEWKAVHELYDKTARYEDVPIWRTHGKYRKQIKRGLKVLNNQRNKEETITYKVAIW